MSADLTLGAEEELPLIDLKSWMLIARDLPILLALSALGGVIGP